MQYLMPDHFTISKFKLAPEHAKDLLSRFTELLEKWNSYARQELSDRNLNELRAIAKEAKHISRNYPDIFPEGYTYEVNEYNIPISFPV